MNKLQKRFHNSNHTNVKFVLITDNETSATRLRQFSGILDVFAINETDNSPFSRFELRSAYVFDNCGHLVYVIHYPWSTVMRPFVKAATLSTLYDGPCGNCERTDVSAFRIYRSAISHSFIFWFLFRTTTLPTQ